MGEYKKMRKNKKQQDYYKKQRIQLKDKKKKILSIKKLISENKMSKALAETEKYLDEYPNDSFGLFQHANILFLLDETEEAKKEFENIVEQNLESKYSASYKLGMIAIQEGDLDKAYSYFKTNIENSPHEEIFSVIELSKIELERGNLKEAHDILYRYTDMSDIRILLQEAIVLRMQGKYEEAYEIINNYNFLDAPDITTNYYIVKGCIEVGLEKFDEAKESLQKAMSREKTGLYYKAETELAHLYYKTGDLNNAATACLDVINNTNFRLVGKNLIILGNIYKILNKYDDAIKCYLKSMDYDYGDQKGYFYTGSVYILKKEYDKAISDLNKCLNMAKNEKTKSMCYLKLALISAKQNQIKNVEKNLNKVKKQNLEEGDLDDYKCLKNHLKWAKKIPSKNNSYSVGQLYNYSLDALIEHIDKVHINGNDKSVFNENIDLEELVCQIPELLSNAQIVNNHYYELYDVKYNNIGYINDKVSNTLRLVVFPGSQKVLTMFPVKDVEKITTLENAPKQKVKSQIEKFNERYGKRNNLK